LIKIELDEKITENSVGNKDILIPTGYHKHLPFVIFVTFISTLGSFVLIFRNINKYGKKTHKN